LRPIHRGMLQFTGFTVLAPHVVYGPAQLSDEQREAELATWAARLPGLAQEAPLAVGTY
jgi:putative NADPH-quinone reductase